MYFTFLIISAIFPNVTPVEVGAKQQIEEDFATLTSLARQNNFTLRDVPRDGNCLFSAMQLQLPELGILLGQDTLRQRLVAYFEEHPYTHDGATHLRKFIAAPFESIDSYNADTEMPNEEDLIVNSIEDTTTRLQFRWCKYLERLASTAWGDHVAVQGLADMLNVDVHILSTTNPNMDRIKTCHTAVGVVYLGLIGQFHYMALERQPAQVNCGSNEDHRPTDAPMHTSEEDHRQVEDEQAFNHQAQLRGLPYECSMHREDIDTSADNVFSVAPGEGQKPIAILTDEHFEEMCYPNKYPCGNFGLMANREKKLTVRKYFNQRLLDADGRFAKDVEYLLTAQHRKIAVCIRHRTESD